MNVTDYLFSAVFIALIFRQVRGRRLTAKGLLLPVVIVAVAADRYLHGFPSGGNNLLLVGVCAGTGLVLGIASALVTRVYADSDGTPVAKAGPIAIVLWIVGTGSRLTFALYATHGGAAAIGRFSHSYDITSQTAWTSALVLMALTEVVGRYGLLALRGLAVRGSGGPPAAEQARRRRAARAGTIGG